MTWDEMSQHYTVSVSRVLKMLMTSSFSCFCACFISRERNLSYWAPRRSSEPRSVSSLLIDKISLKIIW